MTEGFRQQVQTKETPQNLVLISWNIDGLSQNNFIIRIKSVCEILEQEKAEIVFLQEVVPGTLAYLKSKLVNYECLAATGKDYFVATFC